jgi:hypothetical protein
MSESISPNSLDVESVVRCKAIYPKKVSTKQLDCC